MDTYLQKVNDILKKNISEKAFELWIGLNEKMSNRCWEKATSSTGKYHRKEDGRVPSVIEHTYELLYVADKIISMFEGMFSKDIIFLSIALHDSFKYGFVKSCKHTEKKHDQIIGNMVKRNEKIFLQVFNQNDLILLEETTRFHTGKWSTDAPKDFNYSNYNPLVLFLSTLDMMSSKNLIKIVEDDVKI